ncbi:MAG: HD domain-containing protein, partial [Acidimicrobiia bacterium]
SSFLDLRDGLAHSPPPEGGGEQVCRVLSDALDQALARLADRPTDVALVAVGGYGRRELAPFSDVDLMLLGSPSPAAVQAVLYPLWDAKLRVGHSVRTVREAVAAARERADTLCSLLTARTVAGPPEPLEELERSLRGLLRRERARLDNVLAADELERRASQPYHLQEVDVKTGRGGLRCFHALDWERRRAELLGEPFQPPDREEQEAREVLRAVRNALHAVTGRATEVYAEELRPRVAAWLGPDPQEVGRRLFRAVRVGDRLAGHRVESVGDPLAAAGRRVVAVLRSRWGQEPARADGDSSALAVARRALQRPGGRLTVAEAGLLAEAPVPSWTEADREALIRLTAAGSDGWAVLESLRAAGWLARAFPEWERAVGEPQVAPFHAHPVDVHLWRTAQEVVAVAGPDGDEPWCREVADDLGALDEVLLAALFHDIGKGLPGDHSEVGAEVTRGAAARMGFGPATVDTLERAVRHHLLLPRVAARRDLDDPAVIGEVAHLVSDLHTLRVLFLLTIADGRATGPTGWDAWKASLVRALFARTAEELGRRTGS